VRWRRRSQTARTQIDRRSSAVRTAETELPLFPLRTVLLPGGALALRVFEARYVDMVARCLRGENRFGVVAIREGLEVGAATSYDVGTAAEIVDWHQEPGGLLGILAMGREEFRILESRRAPDGLYVGRVAWLAALDPAPLPAEHAFLADLLRRVLAPLPLYRDLPTALDDATWVAARLIELLPLALALKQTLLETRDTAERLAQLATALEAEHGAQ
jgi:Lon protease-like protein